MKQKFIEEGYIIKEFNEEADIYVVNTCTVTNMADRKSRQIFRRVKQINKDAILVVVGCYVQVAKRELEEIDEIDLILGNNEKNEIVRFIEEYSNKKSIVSEINNSQEYKEFGETTYTENVRAFIKVQDGCNNFCAYCIIPYARGRVRSRKIDNVVNEVTEIAKNGIKEVVITGIEIASYGQDFNNDIKLINLLEKLNKVVGIERIRLGSIEPRLITKEFVDRLSKLDKICPQFHLSLQSGCDETLKRMNRKYTTKNVEEEIKLLEEKYDDLVLTADIIVGFPGETEDEFERTYKFLKKLELYKIHTFKYSKRRGTVAEKMDNQISPQIKDERSKKIIELSNEMQQEYNNKSLNNIVEVLFEEKEGDYYKGHTKNYMMIYVKSNDNLDNQIRRVKIEKIENDKIIGKLI